MPHRFLFVGNILMLGAVSVVVAACTRATARDESVGRVAELLTCAPGTTTRASVAIGPTGADDFSFRPTVNSDARFVAFTSLSSNLVAGDANGTFDIFVRDRASTETARVSVSSPGMEANGPSVAPSISASGNILAFASDATNLVSGDTNQVTDVFVRDVAAHTTVRISRSSSGTEANGPSYGPAVSGDGRWVAFHSHASNLVAGDTNGSSDIFLFDRTSGAMSRITRAGTQGNGDSWDPSISADGRFVAFGSDATNLVGSDTNAVRDVFVWDRTSSQIVRVSVTGSGAQANGSSGTPAISADGNIVAFESDATNLTASDTNGVADVFVRERAANRTTRVSVTTSGSQANGASFAPTVNGAARFVGFASDATNLVSGDANGARDIFVRDRTANNTKRVSVASDGASPNDGSSAPVLSGDGLAIVFESSAGNLTDGSICHTNEVFVRDLASTPANWATGVAYTIGTVVTYPLDGFTYQCVQAHTSAADRTPQTVPALWQRPTPCGIAPWAKQTIYVIGSLVTFNNVSYRCLQAHNSAVGQEPNVAPALWQVVP